jgi:hypothetical protein
VVGLALIIPDGVDVTDVATGERIIRHRTEREPLLKLRLTQPSPVR